MPFWHSACDRSTRTAAGEHGFRPALERILTLDFLDRSENLILVGAHGLGKTMLAKNIAHQAVLAGHTALFTTAADLLLDLNGQETARALERRLRHYTRPALLVVDELGYLSYDVRAADLIFQLVSRRYEHRSMLITTNLPFKRWADANDAAARSVSDCRVSPGRSRSGSENAHLSRLRVVASASSSSAISCVRLTLFVQFVRIRNRIMSETISRGGFSSASEYCRSWSNAASRFARRPLYSQVNGLVLPSCWVARLPANPSPAAGIPGEPGLRRRVRRRPHAAAPGANNHESSRAVESSGWSGRRPGSPRPATRTEV